MWDGEISVAGVWCPWNLTKGLLFLFPQRAKHNILSGLILSSACVPPSLQLRCPHIHHAQSSTSKLLRPILNIGVFFFTVYLFLPCFRLSSSQPLLDTRPASYSPNKLLTFLAQRATRARFQLWQCLQREWIPIQDSTQ